LVCHQKMAEVVAGMVALGNLAALVAALARMAAEVAGHKAEAGSHRAMAKQAA
jgi:hypothetical protein